MKSRILTIDLCLENDFFGGRTENRLRSAINNLLTSKNVLTHYFIL